MIESVTNPDYFVMHCLRYYMDFVFECNSKGNFKFMRDNLNDKFFIDG